jgi:metal-dependent hydrolase (beta-lactamase superfamily II)
VALSHSHYDHAGGFPSLMEYVKPKVLYTGKNFWQEKFSYDKEKGGYAYKGCGFTKEDLDSWGIEQFECDGTAKVRLDNYAMLLTGFSHRYDFETIPEKFVRGEDKVPDTFDDEICLLLKEGHGWAMVVGCAHRGILNMAAEVKERTGKDVVRVVGGIHLVGAEDERIRQTFKELKAMGVQYFNLCHCSTDKCHKSCAWPADLEAFAGGLTIQV